MMKEGLYCEKRVYSIYAVLCWSIILLLKEFFNMHVFSENVLLAYLFKIVVTYIMFLVSSLLCITLIKTRYAKLSLSLST